MGTPNQHKQQLVFKSSPVESHVLVCVQTMSCSTALGSNSYRVGGGSNCFPLVGTRDPPITHPASSGGS